jgi:hypothetical protein
MQIKYEDRRPFYEAWGDQYCIECLDIGTYTYNMRFRSNKIFTNFGMYL